MTLFTEKAQLVKPIFPEASNKIQIYNIYSVTKVVSLTLAQD